MNTPQDPEAAETVQKTNVLALDLPRLVRGAPEINRLAHKKAGKAIWELHAGKLEIQRNQLLYDKQTLTHQVDALREQLANNPWCAPCKEPDCCVSGDGTCSMIRKYLSTANVKRTHR
jgi:hypothetical protein